MPLYLGLMSGTSADAIDAALVAIEEGHCKVLSSLQVPLPNTTREQILGLFNPGANEIDRLGALDVQLGQMFADAALQLLNQSGYSASDISAIGSHGQTVRHRPRNTDGASFTLQIGDPNTIAQITGITTVADFRRRDMAAGGQGAPLVPAFHRAMFSDPQKHRVVVNIGGIANLTLLAPDGLVQGFDTGPGNGLMDAWIARCRGEKIDREGKWATGGKVSSALFGVLHAHPFFPLPHPKSTGREEFSLAWLLEILQEFSNLSAQDVQATLLELTARSIAEQIQRNSGHGDVLVCGGGAHNTALMRRLTQLLPAFNLSTTAAFGIPVNDVEAAAFAWLAMRTLRGFAGNIPAVTGAHEEVILGGIYPGGRPGAR